MFFLYQRHRYLVKRPVHPPQVQARHFMVSNWGRRRIKEDSDLLYLGKDGKTRTDKKPISDKYLNVLLDNENDSDDEND